MVDNSTSDESAIGLCHCGGSVSFPPHKNIASCPKCKLQCTRGMTGAASERMQRLGSRVGEGVKFR